MSDTIDGLKDTEADKILLSYGRASQAAPPPMLLPNKYRPKKVFLNISGLTKS